MTHQYPATLPPEAVEDIKRAVAAHQHALVEAYVNVEKYKTQRDEMSERLRKEQADHERTKRALSAAVDEAERANMRADAAERGEG